MPDSGMDWWVILGVIATIAAAFFAWRQARGGAKRTVNTVQHGHRNTQSGGDGETTNSVDHGDDNRQRGA